MVLPIIHVMQSGTTSLPACLRWLNVRRFYPGQAGTAPAWSVPVSRYGALSHPLYTHLDANEKLTGTARCSGLLAIFLIKETTVSQERRLRGISTAFFHFCSRLTFQMRLYHPFYLFFHDHRINELDHRFLIICFKFF